MVWIIPPVSQITQFWNLWFHQDYSHNLLIFYFLNFAFQVSFNFIPLELWKDLDVFFARPIVWHHLADYFMLAMEDDCYFSFIISFFDIQGQTICFPFFSFHYLFLNAVPLFLLKLRSVFLCDEIILLNIISSWTLITTSSFIFSPRYHLHK